MGIEIKEHGIYEQRDGVIVEWQETDDRAFGDYPFKVGGGWYLANGRFNSSFEDQRDLVREIIVGTGWLPHNGGENPVPGKVVEYVMRDGAPGESPDADELAWSHEAAAYDIIAYRIIEEAEITKEDSPAYPGTFTPTLENMGGVQLWRISPLGKKVLTELRSDLPEKFIIHRAENGGYAVSSPKDTLAACSTAADLLAWLTEEVET